MGKNEKAALLELESWCKSMAPNIKSMMLDMHLNRIERARISDKLEESNEPIKPISFEELFYGLDQSDFVSTFSAQFPDFVEMFREMESRMPPLTDLLEIKKD